MISEIVMIPRVVYDVFKVNLTDDEAALDQAEREVVMSTKAHNGEETKQMTLDFEDAQSCITEPPTLEFGPEYLSNLDGYPVIFGR